MAQRVMVDRDLFGPHPDPSIKEVDQEESIKITYDLKDPNNILKKINYNKFDVIYEYFVKDREETYIASKMGDELVNLVLDKEHDKIHVLLADHGLKPGPLMVRIKYISQDKDFPDRKFTTIDTKFTKFIITDSSRYGSKC